MLGHRVDHLGRGVGRPDRREGGGDRGADAGRFERSEPDPVRLAPRGQAGHQVLDVGTLAAARRREQQDRTRRHRVGEIVQHVQGLGVGPLQVVEHQQDARAAECIEQRQRGLADGHRRERRGRTVAPPRRHEDVQGRPQALVRRSGQRFPAAPAGQERLGQRAVGRRGRRRPAVQHRHAAGVGQRGGLGGQPGLAGPRLAVEEDHASGAGRRPLDSGRERVELRGPSDHDGAPDVPHRPTIRSPARPVYVVAPLCRGRRSGRVAVLDDGWRQDMTGDTGTRDRAVVVGASLAGLLTAAVLSEHYRHVTVLDRDVLGPDAPGEGGEFRRGVPQSRHVHALLGAGHRALEELLPGIMAELTGRGAPLGDQLGDARLHLGRRMPRVTSGLPALCVSRPLLEATVRARVTALPGVQVMSPCDVAGLVATPDRRRITGVRVRPDGGEEQGLPADLVVDASGRGSRTPAWLDALGVPAPVEDRVKIGLGYATRTYRSTPAGLAGDLAIVVAPTPPAGRGGALQHLEGGRWIVTLIGVLGDHPPTDPAGFLDFAASLPVPDIFDAIVAAEPIGDVAAFRFPASVRRRYERLDGCPDGLVVVGDALCSFNPVYGQGISVAALEAGALGAELSRGRPLRARRIHRRLARIVDSPWATVTGGDLAFPAAEGRRTRAMQVMGSYIARLQAAAAIDPVLAVAFFRVAGLVDPPSALLRPRGRPGAAPPDGLRPRHVDQVEHVF